MTSEGATSVQVGKQKKKIEISKSLFILSLFISIFESHLRLI